MRARVLPVCLAVALPLSLPACIDRLAEPEQVEEEPWEHDEREHDDDDDVPGPAGSYRLRRVNDKALPVEVHLAGGDDTEIESGQLELAEDGTCSSRLKVVVKKGDDEKKETWKRKCTWSLRDGSLRLRWERGGEQAATWSGDAIVYSSRNVRYAFTRG